MPNQLKLVNRIAASMVDRLQISQSQAPSVCGKLGAWD